MKYQTFFKKYSYNLQKPNVQVKGGKISKYISILVLSSQNDWKNYPRSKYRQFFHIFFLKFQLLYKILAPLLNEIFGDKAKKEKIFEGLQNL